MLYKGHSDHCILAGQWYKTSNRKFQSIFLTILLKNNTNTARMVISVRTIPWLSQYSIMFFASDTCQNRKKSKQQKTFTEMLTAKLEGMMILILTALKKAAESV